MDDKMSKDRSLIPPERIERSILLIRGQKVMLDADLAELYDVKNEAIGSGRQEEYLSISRRFYVSAQSG